LRQRFSLPDLVPNDTRTDPLDEVVFLVLAYRSTPANSQSAYSRLRNRYGTWSALITAPPVDVEDAIRPAGLAHQRAILIQRLVARVIADFPEGSLAPLRGWDDTAVLAYLTSLPGLSRLAASQAMLHALDRRVLPATHSLVRFLTRLGILDRGLKPEHVLTTAASLLSAGQHRQLYDNLLAHAHSVCAPRVPRCRRCHLTDLCAYYKRTRFLSTRSTEKTGAVV